MGKYYYNQSNKPLAFQYLKDLQGKADAHNHWLVGEFFYAKHYYDLSLGFMEYAFQMHLPNSYIYLANMYERGLGCNVDLNLAYAYYKLGTNFRDSQALDFLACLVTSAPYKKKNFKIALECTRKSLLLTKDPDAGSNADRIFDNSKSLKRKEEYLKVLKILADRG